MTFFFFYLFNQENLIEMKNLIYKSVLAKTASSTVDKDKHKKHKAVKIAVVSKLVSNYL